MIRFKITVRMIDNTTEVAIDARQPMRETLMFDAFHECNSAAPRGTRHRRFKVWNDDQVCGPAHRASNVARRTQASLRSRLPALARPRLIM
jgi:hypothetical protein